MKQTILIVEDDNDLRENICSILQNEGFQTMEAINGTPVSYTHLDVYKRQSVVCVSVLF